MPQISPQAIVENGAEFADDVRVGAFSYVGRDVRIGAGCVLENNVTVLGRTTLGEKNHLFPMAVVGAAAEDDAPGRCVLGEGNAVREHATIHGGTDDAPTQIGNGNLIMVGCVIGGGARIGDHDILDNCSHVAPRASLSNYVNMSGFASVQANFRVGAYTFITGYASVDRPAPPFAIVQGCPMRVRGVNWRHLKRCGFGDDDIRAIKIAFRELFNGGGLQVSERALKKLKSHDNPHVRRLVEEVENGRDTRPESTP
jgi:UDP-N-acetylglucosamine acyltransferase